MRFDKPLPKEPKEFEWDLGKEFINISKHGVNFHQARQAFNDEFRIVTDNPIKDRTEVRYYCYGLVDGRIMAVRFTIQNDRIRIIGAAYWRKGRKIYESRSKH